MAREAGISRQRLYDWRDRLRLTGSVKARRRGRPVKASVVSSEPLQQSGEMAPPPEEKALAKARRRISELEQKVGQQQLDLDFFQEALRHIRDDHRQDTAPDGTGSSRSSKMTVGSSQGIERMCCLAEVSRAGYYLHWQSSAPRKEGTALRHLIQQLALNSRHYG
ncbi:hypothetical protein NKJ71_32405 [Mesorhizobium sp. M0050]|uniref:hypothetical protein n=1 Tax=Mesorhizobium sp. M0050 TaxID=2956861 RepID=UPI0033364047